MPEEEFTDEQLEELSIKCWTGQCPPSEVDRLIEAYKELRDREREQFRRDLKAFAATYTPEQWLKLHLNDPKAYIIDDDYQDFLSQQEP